MEERLIFDTHAHFDDKKFDEDRDAVVQRAIDAGARTLLLPNIDNASIHRMLSLCDAYPDICFPMIGLHPTDVPEDADAALIHLKDRGGSGCEFFCRNRKIYPAA